ncbi:MAG: DUF192 domain-containing protein [Rhodocyclaceae bacterium]|nr:MAG: DUF192 domain-containing protein [Rhodocyclaceae bacterium]
MLKKLAIAVAFLSSAGLAHAQSFPVMDMSMGIHRIEAEVAYTLEGRMQGLMFRQTMGENHGMLFVFPEAQRHCMWMRNTLLPLSVAFLDDKGQIINVEDMQPKTENNHCAAKPARYALEMNLGWFKRKGFAAGAPLGGIERAPAPQ